MAGTPADPRLQRLATWPVAALLLVAWLLCDWGFSIREQSLCREMLRSAGAAGLRCEGPTLDPRFTYTPGQARDLLAALGPDGRRIYAWTEVTLDLVFPFVYGTLFGILLVRLARPPAARRLLWLPALTAAADLLENVTVAILAWTFAGRASPLAGPAAFFTAGKTVLFGVTLLAIIALAVARLRGGRTMPAVEEPSGGRR